MRSFLPLESFLFCSIELDDFQYIENSEISMISHCFWVLFNFSISREKQSKHLIFLVNNAGPSTNSRHCLRVEWRRLFHCLAFPFLRAIIVANQSQFRGYGNACYLNDQDRNDDDEDEEDDKVAHKIALPAPSLPLVPGCLPACFGSELFTFPLSLVPLAILNWPLWRPLNYPLLKIGLKPFEIACKYLD